MKCPNGTNNWDTNKFCLRYIKHHFLNVSDLHFEQCSTSIVLLYFILYYVDIYDYFCFVRTFQHKLSFIIFVRTRKLFVLTVVWPGKIRCELTYLLHKMRTLDEYSNLSSLNFDVVLTFCNRRKLFFLCIYCCVIKYIQSFFFLSTKKFSMFLYRINVCRMKSTQAND